jgi:PAS domain S-box-containing protein
MTSTGTTSERNHPTDTAAELALLRAENARLQQRIAALEQQDAHHPAASPPPVPRCKQHHHPLPQGAFAALAENSPDAIAIATLEGTIIYANATSQHLTGFGAGIIGKSIFEIFSDDQVLLTRHFQHTITHGSWSGMVTVNRQDGSTFTGQLSATLICDAAGQPEVVAGTVRDMTDQTAIEAELRSNLHFLETLLNTIPSPVFYKDTAGRYIRCNQLFAEQVIGLPREYIIGHTLPTVAHAIPADIISMHQEYDTRLLQQHESDVVVYEAPVQCADGQCYDFLFYTTTFTDSSGNIAGIVGVMLDITRSNHLAEHLHSQLALAHLIMTISTRFITLDTHAIYAAIKQALHSVGKLAAAEGAYIIILSEDEATIETSYGWHSDGSAPDVEGIKRLSPAAFTWAIDQLHRHEVINVPCVAEMPPAAAAEQRYCASVGLQSLIVIPMVCGSVLVGSLSFSTSSVAREWSEESTDLLKVVGNIFANAIVRKRMEEKLHQANDELEQRVLQRTFQLNLSHRALQAEVEERKRVAEALRHREVLMRLITDALPSLIAYVDSEGCYRFNNRSYEAWVQCERATLIGTPVREVLSPDLYAQVAPRIEQALAGETVQYDYRLQHPDGDTRYLRVNYIPHWGESGSVQGFVMVGNDITDKVLDLQRLEQKVAERTREIERRRQAAEALYGTLRILNTSEPLDAILHYIMQHTCSILATAASAIYCPSPEGRAYVRAARGLPDAMSGLGNLPILRNAEWEKFFNREPIVVHDLQAYWAAVLPDDDAAWAAFAHEYGDDVVEPLKRWREMLQHYRACISIPIFIQDEMYGGLELYYLTAHHVADEEIALAAAFGQQIALAIENAWLREQVEQLAVIQERQRVAQDLHDSVTQSLCSLTYFAEALRQQFQQGSGTPDEQAQIINSMMEIARSAHVEMRLLIHQLRPPALERGGLAGALRERLNMVEKRAGLKSHLQIDDLSTLPPELEEALYWIVVEALNNVLWHAEASLVTITLQLQQHEHAANGGGNAVGGMLVSLEIRDDGVGFDLQAVRGTGGVGLKSMHERATRHGGTLTIEAQPGAGTVVRVQVRC